MAKLAFEVFNVNGLFFADEPVLALYSMGKASGLVVNIGHDTTGIHPPFLTLLSVCGHVCLSQARPALSYYEDLFRSLAVMCAYFVLATPSRLSVTRSIGGLLVPPESNRSPVVCPHCGIVVSICYEVNASYLIRVSAFQPGLGRRLEQEWRWS